MSTPQIVLESSNLIVQNADFVIESNAYTNIIYNKNYVSTETDLSSISATTYHGMVMHVHATGALYYAHAGVWRKLITDTSGGSITNYTDPLASVAYSGNFSDITGGPSLDVVLNEGSTTTQTITAGLFVGDGGLLSNVSGGGAITSTTDTVTVGGLVVNTSKGTSTVSSGTLTVDQDSKSYKISNISTSGTISALTWSNLVSGAQHALTLEAYGGDITFSNSLGTGLKTSYNTTTISSGNCGVVTLYYDDVNTFVNCVTYPA